MQAIIRAAVWTVVWATILRNIGGSIGVWAAGSLSAVVTILIGVVIPVWLFMFFPSWLAWRVAQPLGMPVVAAVASWMSPLVRMRDLHSISVFMAVAAGRPFPARGELPADAWIAHPAYFGTYDRLDVVREWALGCRTCSSSGGTACTGTTTRTTACSPR